MNRLASAGLLVLLYACGGGGGSPGGPAAVVTPSPVPHIPRHIVVIVQENRTVDDMFQGFPGADTQRWGLDSHGNHIPLVPVALDAPFGVLHDHVEFVTQYDGGRMDGFDSFHARCGRPNECGPATPYVYVRPSDVAPYWSLAEQFGLADEVLQSNEGSSFAAHQYLIAGQSGHPWAMIGFPDVLSAGCDPPANVLHIDMTSPYPGVYGNKASSCKDYATIFDLVAARGLSWRYYTPFPRYIFNAPYAIHHIFFGAAAQNDKSPETTILADVAAHRLADLSYLVSRTALSDHPQLTGPNGPKWIATITNAIFTDPYYFDNTVVLLTWDDWGGWYDHVSPRHPAGLPDDPYEYGFRVPLVVVSPFVRQRHLVDHTPRDQTAILHFIETTFGLSSLGQLDAKTDDLRSMFDFTRPPLGYTRIDTGGFTPRDVLRAPLGQGED